jgi:hypothetical protein
MRPIATTAASGAWLIVCLLLVGSAAPALALTVGLDPTALPSSQGWAFSSFGVAEGDVFSSSAAGLEQDSLAAGQAVGVYHRGVPVNTVDPIVIRVNARLSSTSLPAGFGPGYYFGVSTQEERFSLVLEPGRVTTLEGSVLGSLDTEVARDYELIARPGEGFSLFVDGALFAVGGGYVQGGVAKVEFGDGSFSQNAAGVLASFSLVQAPGAVPLVAPEPSAGLLLLAGLDALRRARRDGRSSGSA